MGFQAMGMTGLLLARQQKGREVIDWLLMSCRIPGRQLEIALRTKVVANWKKRDRKLKSYGKRRFTCVGKQNRPGFI